MRRDTDAALVLAVVTLRLWIGRSARLKSASPASDVDQRDAPLATDCGADSTLGLARLAGDPPEAPDAREPVALPGRDDRPCSDPTGDVMLEGECGAGTGSVAGPPLSGDAPGLWPAERSEAEAADGLRRCDLLSMRYGCAR